MSCLGECYARLGRFDEAIEVLERTLQLMEADKDTWGDEELIDEYARVSKFLEYSKQHNKSLKEGPASAAP
jgi:pentatricopeptide repeat protein